MLLKGNLYNNGITQQINKTMHLTSNKCIGIDKTIINKWDNGRTWFGHPKGENGNNPEENQVSSTSSSNITEVKIDCQYFSNYQYM